MKILVFIWRDITHPQAGGSEIYMHEIAKRWVKWGHQVTFFCGAYKRCKVYNEIDGIRIIRKGGRFGVYLRAFWEYIVRFRKEQFNIIIDVENGIPFFTPLFVSKPKVAVLYHIHKEVFSKELPFYLAWIAYLLEIIVMPILYRKIKFITISESSKREMIKYGFKQDNIKIVYPGIDHEKYKPKISSKAPFFYIVYLGRLKKYKSVDLIIKAMKYVVREIPEAKLVIIGRGERRQNLEELVRKLRLRKNVEFQGYVTESEKVRMLQKAHVMVTPSFKEGWGITSLEANACGTPVIASDVPGLRDSVLNGKTGFLIPYGDSKKMFKKITAIARDIRLRNNLSRNAIEWSKRFNWNKSAQEGLRILERIADFGE